MNVVVLLIALPVLAYDEPTELELSIPGKTEGTGTYFEIKDSEYLDITLGSAEEIKVVLESIPRMISLDIETATENINSTELTIQGLESNKTYYKYQDSYKNEAVFISSENGAYSWVQDLSQPHHVWFQEIKGTTFISEDTVLDYDITGSVEITTDNITLDCDGHSITGSGGGYGIYLKDKSGVTIKNCSANNFHHDIYLYNSSNNVFFNNIVTNKYNKYASGIYFYNSSNNTLIDNTAISNGGFGIYLYRSGDTTLINNTMTDNQHNFDISGTSDEHFMNDIDTTNTVDNKPIYYIQNATDQIYDNTTNVGTIYCIFCNNVTVENLVLTKNSCVFFWRTQNSKIERVSAPDNNYGISLYYSNSNTISNNRHQEVYLKYSDQNTLSHNEGKISLSFSNNNILINNIANVGSWAGIYLDSSSNNILDSNTTNLNKHYGVYLESSSKNSLINNNISNNPWGIALYSSENNTLDGNTVSFNDSWGIILSHSPSTTLISNSIFNNLWNFSVYGDVLSEFIHNIDTSNKVNDKPIQYLISQENVIIDSSWDIGYLGVINSTNVTIKDLTLSNNGQGILFAFSNDSKIDNVNVSNTRDGILLINKSSNNILTSNKVSNNVYGIPIIYSSNNNTLINNNISNNYYGIDLTSSSENILTNNVVNSNSSGGIFLYSSNSNKIISNVVMNSNGYGIRAVSSNSNNLVGNDITSNEYIGIYLGSCSSNRIYHNNFIDNNYAQAYVSGGSDNLFDDGYPDGGNYWSDYIGVDFYNGPEQDQSGSDRIGDTPYTFTGGEDGYPFMEESGWEVPPIPTYNVAVILAESADVLHESDPEEYQPCKLLPEKTYPNGRSKEYYQDLTYCVVDYHKENSFETINLDFEIFDDNGNWFKTDKNEEDYLGKKDEFVIDAITLARNKGIELANYDMVIVVHSGTSYQKDYIPILNPHPKKLFTSTWTPDNQPLGYPPYKILVAEDDFIGGQAHEIGHIIGAIITSENTITPDLYKMGNVGKWDLMAGGAWNNGLLFNKGTNPPFMSSYTKEFLQWLNYDIHPKSAYGEHWINSLETSEFGDKVFRYNLTDDVNDESSKYYILETRNRDLKTWDSSLPELTSKHLILYYVDTKGLPEYGYVPEGVIEYQEGMMWNQYRTVTIPGEGSINDGILNPLFNETYRDLDNLVKFSAITDRTVNDKYEIQTKIEEITYDSFNDKFWGIVLRPKSTFKKWLEKIFVPNSIKTSEFYKIKNNFEGIQLTATSFNPQEREGEIGTPVKYSKGETIRIIKIISFEVLISIILLNLLLILLNKKVFPRWRLEKTQRAIKITIKILWIISIIIVIVSISLLVVLYTTPEPSPKPPGVVRTVPNNSLSPILFPPLEPTTSPDLDLHLYCEGGRHIGMDYETGEYEIQIEEAIVSGDNQNAPEWIFIPPDITNCHFVVSSYDNQKFLEENPEIAQEIEDTTDSYDVYARYIDPEADIYISTIISEDIKPGIELEHQISGTHDIAIGPGILLARVDFNPDTLNLKNKGKWVTVYIELPKDYDPNLIDLNTVLLNGQIPAENNPKYEFVTDSNSYLVDIDNNDILERMVKFDQSAVQDILETGEEVEIIITGKLIDGSPFQGSDIIKVISKGKWKNILSLGFLTCFMVRGLLIYRRRVRKRNGVLNKKSK